MVIKMLDITGKFISKLLLTFKTIFPNYVGFERMENDSTSALSVQ